MDSGALGYGQGALDAAAVGTRFVAAGRDYQTSHAALVMSSDRPTVHAPLTYPTASCYPDLRRLEQGPPSFTGAAMGTSVLEPNEDPASYSGAQKRRYMLLDADPVDGPTRKRPKLVTGLQGVGKAQKTKVTHSRSTELGGYPSQLHGQAVSVSSFVSGSYSPQHF